MHNRYELFDRIVTNTSTHIHVMALDLGNHFHYLKHLACLFTLLATVLL